MPEREPTLEELPIDYAHLRQLWVGLTELEQSPVLNAVLERDDALWQLYLISPNDPAIEAACLQELARRQRPNLLSPS